MELKNLFQGQKLNLQDFFTFLRLNGELDKNNSVVNVDEAFSLFLLEKVGLRDKLKFFEEELSVHRFGQKEGISSASLNAAENLLYNFDWFQCLYDIEQNTDPLGEFEDYDAYVEALQKVFDICLSLQSFAKCKFPVFDKNY